MALQCPPVLRESRPGLLRQSSSVVSYPVLQSVTSQVRSRCSANRVQQPGVIAAFGNWHDDRTIHLEDNGLTHVLCFSSVNYLPFFPLHRLQSHLPQSNIVEAYATLHVRNSALQRASTCYSAPSTPPRKLAYTAACSSCEDEKENIRLLRSAGPSKQVVSAESVSHPAKAFPKVGSQTSLSTKRSLRRLPPPSFDDANIEPVIITLSKLAPTPTATSDSDQTDSAQTRMSFDSDADSQTTSTTVRTAIRSRKAAGLPDISAGRGSPISKSPKTPKSPHKMTSPSPRRQKTVPQWTMPQADPPEDVSLPKDSVLPPSSILRPTYRSQSENSKAGSPTKKLQRKQSTTRVRKDSGTSGHSRSFSLPRTISAPDYTSATYQETEAEDGGRPAWLDCDPVEGNSEPARSATPSFSLMSSSVSLPAVTGDGEASTQDRQSKRKPSFYKRKRSQTASNVAEVIAGSTMTKSDSAGFPMPSPQSEIVKAMPLNGIKLSDSSLLSRKRSQPNLSAQQPDTTDYFGNIQQEPPKSAKSWLSFGNRIKHDAPLPPIPLHHTSTLSSPATKESSAFATSSPLSKGHGRSRSGSVTSLNGQARSTSISEPILISRNNVPVPPVPAMPSHMRGQSQAEVVVSPIDAFRGNLGSPRKSPRTIQSPKIHKRAPSVAPNSPSNGLTGARSPPASQMPLSPPKRSMSVHRPPTSPSFRKASRTGSSPGAEQEREAKFLELLTRSDKAENGVLKVSLTSKAAKSVGIA